MDRSTYQRNNKQTTTEEVHSLDISQLEKNSYIYPRWTYSYEQRDSTFIGYTIASDELIISETHQTVPLDKTRCNYGGYRYWFKCPQCNERSGVLYKKDSKCLCRHCHKMPYSSQRESEVYRLVRKIRKIRKRLGAPSNLSEPILLKPKGMHWKTFEYLRDTEMILSQKYAQATIAYLGINLEYQSFL